MSRPMKFRNADELLYYFRDYLNECQKADKYPNLAGFSVFIGTHKDTISAYKEETHPFSEAMKMIYNYLEDATINNKMTDNFKKFYMTNTFKEYKDKQDITTNNNTSIDIQSVTSEDIQHKIDKMLGK